MKEQKRTCSHAGNAKESRARTPKLVLCLLISFFNGTSFQNQLVYECACRSFQAASRVIGDPHQAAMMHWISDSQSEFHEARPGVP